MCRDGDRDRAGPGAHATLGRQVFEAGRFLWGLPAWYRHPLTLAHARASLERRLARRQPDFLGVVRAIYADDQSPYHQLLAWPAACMATWRRSSTGTLRAPWPCSASGVYLTVDEFKGRRPAVRGSATIVVRPQRLRNPAAFALGSRTSGSRGAAMLVPSSLDSSRDRAVNTWLTLDAHGGRDWVKAVWGLSTGSLGLAIRYSGFGAPVARCFGLVDPGTPGLHPRYRWSARVLGWASRVGRLPLHPYEHVPVGDPLPIARWMSEVLRAGRIPHLWAFVSPAVRLCQAAVETGVDIRGARFTITGEPITAARRAAIRRAGSGRHG